MSRIPEREEALFADALERPAEERRVFLARACGADISLLTRMITLLAAHDAPEPILACMPPPLLSFPAEKPGDRIGRYRLIQNIGEGGCGVVWMAEQEEPVRRRVALKVIKLGMDTKAVVARFEAERQALAMMDHPYIAKVHDAGSTDSGRPFFVMELVRGIPITIYCDEARLAPIARLELFIKVCQAVQHAHQKGIIHRDLKPSNILVTLDDDVPTPKIIDFGIAKATQGKLTEATVFTAFEQFLGTPVYMSPEQAEVSSFDVDTRTDVYSLGVLLYELLTGKPPFDSKAFVHSPLEEVRRHIRDDEPPKPSTRWRTLSEAERLNFARLRATAPGQLSVILGGDLNWIVMHCLEKDRTRRYQTANGIAADIQRYLRHEPVIARPPSTAYLLQKLVRRHRVVFAAGVSVLGVVLLAAVASTWQAVRATRAEREQSVLRQAAQQAQAREAELRGAEVRLRRLAEAHELMARQRAYAADMNLTQQAVATENFGRARELLKLHEPAPGERDLRGWEWRYLWQACRRDEGDVLAVIPALAWSLAASSDQKWLAAGWYWWPGELGGRVSVFDIPKRESFELNIGDTHTLVAFSPTEPVLAIAGRTRADTPDGTVRSWVELWDLNARQMEQRLEIGERCAAMVFSQDGQILVTSTYGDGGPKRFPTVTHWRTQDGYKISSYRAPETSTESDSEYPFAVSSDLQLAAYPGPQELLVVDLNTGEERWRKKIGIPTALAFSPDGRLLATGSYASPAIQLWDVATGADLGRLDGHRRPVQALAFFPDGKTLASGSADRTVRLWDVPARRHGRTLSGPQAPVVELTLIRGTDLLVASERSGPIRMWHSTARPEGDPAAGVINDVIAWRFSTDNRSIFTIHRDTSLSEWHIPGFERKRQIEINRPQSMRDSLVGKQIFPTGLFAPDRPLVALGSREGIVWVFDFDQGSLLGEFKISSGWAVPTAFLDRGARLIIYDGSRSPPVYHEYDLKSGFTVATWPAPERHHESFVHTPDERHAIMLRPDDGSGLLRDIPAGTSRPIRLSIDAVTSSGFSPDGRIFAAASRKGYAKLWRFPEFEEIATLSGSSYTMTAVAFAPFGGRLATGSTDDEAVRIWDIESRQGVLLLPGVGGPFHETAFSSDGAVLGSLSNSRRLHLWRAPSWREIEAAEEAEAAKAGGR